jgi:transglutaminase-like putative cysteine protease
VRSVERFFQFALLGLAASGFFALADARYLDLLTIALTIVVLVLRGLMVGGVKQLAISPSAASWAAIACLLFYPLDYYFVSHEFFLATLHGVCFLAGVKILTASSNRDYLYTAAVSFLELIAAALLSFQARFFLWLALYMCFAIAAFTSAEIRRGLARGANVVQVPRSRLGLRLTLVTAGAATGILVITGGLFLLVPRTARAAAMFFPGGRRMTGFARVVDLGGFGEIAKDNRPVMRIRSYSAPLPPGLKWRGTALSRFDGRRWFDPPLPADDVPATHGTAEVAEQLQRSRRDGRRLLYRVDVNRSDTGTLFIAGTPEFINFNAPRLIRTSEDAFRVLPVTGGGLTYEVSSHWGPPLPVDLTPLEYRRFLRLPAIDGRILKLAHEWTAFAVGPAAQAEAIEEHLRHDYRYSLETATERPAADPLAHFLFDTRRGYCEFFASAMAVMLRSLDIPSRVATGFQGGYYNEVSESWVVRASDAHAWVEAWFPGRGWVTFDPTPSAEPENAGLLSRFNMYLDAADGLWQRWVMAYDFGQQAEIAARVERFMRNLKPEPGASGGNVAARLWDGAKNGLIWAMAIALLAAFAVFGAPRMVRALRRRANVQRVLKSGGKASDATLLYQHMLDSLASRGYHKPAWFTPQEFVRSLPPEESAAAAEFTALYYSSRFGGDRAATSRLAELLPVFEGK